MHDKREILYLHVPRKKVKQTVNRIRDYKEDVVITINDIKPVYGGYKLHRK